MPRSFYHTHFISDLGAVQGERDGRRTIWTVHNSIVAALIVFVFIQNVLIFIVSLFAFVLSPLLFALSSLVFVLIYVVFVLSYLVFVLSYLVF